MESNSEASCISDPNFAVICAFLERFASSCGITYPPFLDLQEMLENMEQVPQELVDLHIILLRKARRSVFREKWEKALVKFCHTYSTQDGWEIERFGYKNSRLEVKLRVLKTLLEGQFDLNSKFKTTINTLEATDLRSKPLGKDKHGKIYWLQIDPTSNIRVYREDPDEETWALVAKDRDSLVQLLQELTADEDSTDVNLLIEDSSVSADLEKTLIDTGQEICNGDNDGFLSNGDVPVEEKDPLEIKDGDDTISEVKTEESQSDIVTDDGKRMNGDAEEEGDLKKVKLDGEVNGDEVGEAIEDPVMHVYGEGNGAECDAGNPDKEDNKSDESSPTNAGEQSESVSSGQTSAEVIQKIEMEIKPQPKLWSIDTICGTGSLNHSGESSKNTKVSQKNFSSFSIESVLEKKTDVGRSSSPASESVVISVNAVAVNNAEENPNVVNVHEGSDTIISVDNVSESSVCNANCEEISSSGDRREEGTNITKNLNEIDPVPIAEKLTDHEDSTTCAEKTSDNSEERLTEAKIDEGISAHDPAITNENQLEEANDNEIVEKSSTNTPDLEGEEVTKQIEEESDTTDKKSTTFGSVQEITRTVSEAETSVLNATKMENNEVEFSKPTSDTNKPDESQSNCENIESINVVKCRSEIADFPQDSNKELKEISVEVMSNVHVSEDNERVPKKQICIANEKAKLDDLEEVKAEDKLSEDAKLDDFEEVKAEDKLGEKAKLDDFEEVKAEDKLGEKAKLDDLEEVKAEDKLSEDAKLDDLEEVKAEDKLNDKGKLDDLEEAKAEDKLSDKGKLDDLEEAKADDKPSEKWEPVEVVEEKEFITEKSTIEIPKPVKEEFSEDKVKVEVPTVPVDGHDTKELEDLGSAKTCEITLASVPANVSKSEPVQFTEDEQVETPAVEKTVKCEKGVANGDVEKEEKEIKEPVTSDLEEKIEAVTQETTPLEVSIKKEGDREEPESIPETNKQSEPEDNIIVKAVTAPEEVTNEDTLADNEMMEVAPLVLTDKLNTVGESVETPDIKSEQENVPLKEDMEEKATEISLSEREKDESIPVQEPILDTPSPEALPKEAEENLVSKETPREDLGNDEAIPADISMKKFQEETLENDIVDSAEKEHKEGQTETKKKIETRRTSRSRKQSAEEMETGQIPARTTRSGKKSVDEDPEGVKEPIMKTTRKRKSQDTVDEPAPEDAPEVKDIPATVEDTQPMEADLKKPEEICKSAVNPVSDENSIVPQEERKVVRRRKKRGKKSRIRKSVEEKRNQRGNSSDDDKKPAEAGEGPPNEEETKKKSSKSKPKDATPRTRQLIPERELKLLGISNMEELPTVRQSRRIAQLKLKEEAERNRIKKLEEEAAKEEEEAKKLKKKKSSKSSSKKRKSVPTGEESYEEEEEEDDDDDEEAKAKKEKKRRKKKDKLVFNELNPWISSTESSTADEEEDEIEEEPHEDEEILFKSDHEFSPESDIEDPDYKPIKRARTAKVDPKEATESDTKYDDTACEKCGEKDHPEWILLCDKCDKGWHASCVRPALMVVPEGDWFCPPCEHTSLVQKLRDSLVEYDRCQKQRENEELRKKRLAFVGISLDNVLPAKKDKKPKPIEQKEGESDETASGSGSDDESSSSGSSDSDSSSSEDSDEPVYQLRERRSNITSYRYNEYDELIKSALQEEMEAVKGVGLGKGKDIRNQGGEYDEEKESDGEEEVEGNAQTQKVGENVIGESTEQPINPHIPKDILQAKPRIKPKKDDDQEYEVDTDAEEEDEEYNQEHEGEDEEEEELADELPPVVPQYDKKKKKSRSLNVKSLDFTSDEEEEDNSDSDFKGESSEEESEYSLPSESESSDGVRRNKRNYDGPVRRSTRARTARYDREFINDDSEDDAPRRKRSRNVWVESESSDSDRSWGKRKKRGGRSGNRSTVPKKKSKSKGGKRKKSSKKKNGDSDNDYGQKLSKKVKNPKIKYGGLDDLDEEQVLTRRTRGKKINYQEMNASDSDDEAVKKKPRMIGESDEEFVAEKEKSDESEEDEMDSKREANGKAVSKKLIMQKMKKKKRKIIPDPDDLSEDELLDDEELDEFAEELADLDEEEGSKLEEMLSDGNVPIHELKEALRKLKEKRTEKVDGAQTYPPIPDHMENPGTLPKFPKIGKMKITPSRAELAAQLGVSQETVVASMRANSGVLPINPPKEGLPMNIPETIAPDQPGLLLMNEQKDSKDALLNLQPPPYPFPPEAPPSVPPAMVNPHHQFPLNSVRPPIPPFNSFQGIISQPPRLPPEYSHTNIPTTVLGIENDASRNQGRKPVVKAKRKNEEGLSPQGESGEENSGDGRLAESLDSSPKRRGRGRGKKQLLAEAQAKQELGISTVQAPTQFPPQGLPPEGGSVITRMLNTPQGPQPFADFSAVRGRPPATFRPPFPNALRPPLNSPSPSRLRSPAPGLFHASHPLDPTSSAINLPQTKPLPPGFPARPPVLPRYPSDPSLRPPFPAQSSPSRSDTYPYPNFYGPYPPAVPNSEDAPFQNPNFPNHPFDEHHPPPHLDGSGGPSKVAYDEEGGEFGGLASYFASQREDDLDT